MNSDIDIKFIYGQCYDGASTMQGNKTGVVTQIKALSKKAVSVHCFGHGVDLEVRGSYTNIPVISKAFEGLQEIAKLVRKSSKQKACLDIKNRK